MGLTGNLRTTRGQSSTAGSRTIRSILSNGGSSSGAGSFIRIYNWYSMNGMKQEFYNDVVFKMNR
jgi:hypothetical protein